MVESSSHNPYSLKITPKEEPVTLDKPKSPNPFLPTDQIEFTFKEIAFTTNNEVALLYPSHLNSEYFREGFLVLADEDANPSNVGNSVSGSASIDSQGNRYSLKDKNGAKTEHENGKSVKSQINFKNQVPLTTVGDLHKLINDIEASKHDELLSGMNNDDRMESLAALGTICNSIQADNNNADEIPCKVSHIDDSINLNVDEPTIPSDPIVQSVDINTKLTSYAGDAGASAKDQPKVKSNFLTLVADPVFDGVNISIPRKVVEKVRKHGLKRIMMNSKGFFFFKFDSRAGLEAVLEGGPWLIRKSSIILKKWSMDTRLLKKELTCILIWVKLHDVPIQVFEEDGISLIATFIGKPVMLDSYTSSICNESWGRSSFARCLIEVNSKVDLVDVVTIGIPSLYEDGFTKETIRVEYEWRPPRCDIYKIFCHVHDHCPKKVVSPPIVTTYNVVTPTVEKTNDGFQMVGKKRRGKTTGKSSKKDNLSMSNSFSALNDEEEDVETVYDESANLI
ncbi:zinc knuckle CX2CX4HX4C containing protein [Tanacetum coccineum]